MPLTLVTGPANAAKAGAVFARYREWIDRRPLLVVPTAADAGHYARELAASGVVVGAEVVHFRRLIRAIAEAAGVPTRTLGDVARERVVRAAVRDVRLEALAASAAAPGFAPAVGALFAELGHNLVTPQRFISALRQWRGDAYAQELGALFGAYHRRLERLGVVDQQGLARAALDALREQPARWERRPVLLYGFDDLSRVQLDAVETLALRAEAEVVVSLPYEPGRAALAGCASTVEELRPLAAAVVALQERAEHYAEDSREALHHLERSLFEEPAERVEPGDAVRLLEAGGARAEAELVGATVLELLGDAAPEDVAVVLRDEAERPLFEQVLTAYGVPVTHDRRVRLTATRLGAGLAAMLRAAGPDGTAADLVAWLRTPGRLQDPDAADRLEAAALRAEALRPGDALTAWRTAAWRAAQRTGRAAAAAPGAGTGPAAPHPDTALVERVRDALAALRAAAAEGPLALLEAVTAEAEAVWTAPHARQAAVLDPEDAVDARAAAELRRAADELRRLAEADPRLLRDASDVLEALGAIEVREAEAGLGVLLADPLAIRARRFRAVVVCGLQDGAFPSRPAPDPFLPDDDRRSLAAATDLRLPMREDVLARERSLFYACVSRPEQTLVLSFRSSTEDGDPLQPSPFVEDVRAVFTDALWTGRRKRLLADVTWAPREAPTAHELRRAYAAARTDPDPAPLGAPATAAVLAVLAGREQVSARELEAFAGCGVRWLIERVLKPGRAEPDSIYLRRGALEHELLERTLTRLRERLGSARLHPGSADAAVEELDGAVGELRATTTGARARATLRGVQLTLTRVLRHEAEHGAQMEPTHLEWDIAPLDLGTIRVSGRVDRVDVQAGKAVVRDYKRRGGPGGAKWAEGRRIQVALYAQAVREQLGVEPVGAVFQPLIADLRPRGLIRDGEVAGTLVDTDRLDGQEFAAALDALRALATAAGGDLRAGRIRACPSRCGARGACAYPGICRGGEGEGGAPADGGSPE
jgi:hypothetical protein